MQPALAQILDRVGRAEIVRDVPAVSVCRDPNDDMFFACAVAGNADYIVSEDNDVLAISEHAGIRTVTAAQFIALLDSE